MSKILYCGAHGVGKSTAILKDASNFKQRFTDKNIYIVQESTRRLNKLLSMRSMPKSFQKLVILNAMSEELVLESEYHYIFCDRSAIDSVVYSIVNNIKLPNEYVNLAIEHLKSFDIINFVRPNKRYSIQDDGFRNTDIKYRNKIDKVFKKILDDNKISYNEGIIQDGKFMKL